MKVSVIIPAAGSSNRMGFNKILEPLFDVPVIVHTIRAFDNVDAVTEIILATAPEMIDFFQKEIVAKYQLIKVKKIIAGGETRTTSVLNAYNHISKDSDLVAIHDAARPFVSRKTIISALELADQKGAVIVVNPIFSTVKQINQNDEITGTIDRQFLRAAGTPQVFKSKLFAEAIKAYFCYNSSKVITDDAQLLELAGKAITILDGNLENIKLTTPFDWQIAKACGQEWFKTGLK